MSKNTTKSARKPARKPQRIANAGAHANTAAFSESRPGVLAVIVGELERAHPHGIAKAGIVAALVKAFPDRDEAKMKSTVAMQVPSGLRIERGYALTRRLADGAKLFSLAPAEKQAGDTWRATKRNDPKGAAKLMDAIKKRAAMLSPATTDSDE